MKMIVILVCTVLFFVAAPPSWAVSINFDDQGLIDGSIVTNYYPGVTFNGIANPFPSGPGRFISPPTVPAILGGTQIWDPLGRTAPGESPPNFAVGSGQGQPGDGGILMTFSNTISSLTVTGLDFGNGQGDVEDMTLTAYNSAGDQFGWGYFTGQFADGAIRGTISFTGMKYVAFNYGNTQYGFYGIDDLEYTPSTQVPEPVTLVLLGSSLLGLIGIGKKFKA